MAPFSTYQCTRCQHPIIKAVGSDGSTIWINPEPSRHGTVEISRTFEVDGTRLGIVHSNQQARDLAPTIAALGKADLYVLHAWTCPSLHKEARPNRAQRREAARSQRRG